MQSPQTTGEVIAFDRSPLKKEEFVEAIRLWRQTRDLAQTLSREEIGALRGFDRVDALRKSIIENLAHYYRAHERADVAPGVLVLQSLLCDNERGAATISQPSLAKFFNRSISSIADAQKRLRNDGLIVTSKGRYAETYPVIPRAMTMGRNHLTWLVGSVCDDGKPFNLLTGPIDCQSTGPVKALKSESDQSSGRTLGLKSVNHPVDPPSIIRPDPMQSHSNNSTTLKEETVGLQTRRAIASVAIGIASVATPMAAAAQPTPPAIVQPANREIPYTELKAKLMEAGGEAIGTNAGLEVLSLPRAWLADGCDLMEDILPVIRARSAKRPTRSIQSWSFFTQAIADAKATRLRPMEVGTAKSAFQDRQERQRSSEEAWANRIVMPATKPRPADEVL